MGSKKSTATATAEPWSPSQPYVLDTMRRAQNLYNTGPSTVAPFSPDQLNAFSQYRDLAAQPVNENVGLASGVIGNTLQGGMIGRNPYIQSADTNGVYNGIADRVMKTVGDQFTAAGRTGSPAEQAVMAREITNAYAPYAYNANEAMLNRGYNDYATGQQNQLRAAQYAPQLAAQEQQLGLFGPSLLSDIGSQYQGLNAQYRNEPYSLLQNFYSPIVQGTAGLGENKAVTEPGGSRLGGLFGGALAGGALGSEIGGLGAVPGAILGGLGGLF